MRYTLIFALFFCCSIFISHANEGALQACLEAEEPIACLLSIEPHSSVESAEINSELSSLFLDRGLLDKALEHGFIAVEKAKDANDQRILVKASMCVGDAYRRNHDFTTSLTHYVKAKNYSTDSTVLPRLYNSIGILYSQLGKFDPSKSNLDSGLAIARATKDTIGMARILTNLGWLHNRAELYEEAIAFYLESIALKKHIDNPASLAYSLNDLGEVYSYTGKLKKARSLSIKAIELASQASHIYYMRDMNKTLATTYEMMGKYDSAYLHQLVFQEYQDSISNQDQARQIAELEKQKEIQEKDAANTALSAEVAAQQFELRKRNTLLLGAAIALILFAFLGSLLYKSNQQRKRLLLAVHEQNMRLEEQNFKLEKNFNEQESLFNIVTHDIKGPLANAIQLLELEGHETDPKTKAELKSMVILSANNALEFIRDFDTIQAYERRTEKPPIVTFELSELLSTIIGDFKMELEEKSLNIHSDTSQTITVHSIKEYVRHIIYNLLSNAIKYSPKGGSIFISLVDGEVPRVSIEDQGPGIPAELQERIFERFFRGQSSDESQLYNSSGLGLAVTKLLTDKIGGRIKLKSQVGKGSEFIVYLG